MKTLTARIRPRDWRATALMAALGLLLFGAVASAHEPTAPTDAPGFRPDSALAAGFVKQVDSATIVVHPTIVRRASRTAASYTSRDQSIRRLKADGVAAEPGELRHDFGRLQARSQWAVFEASLARVGDAIRARRAEAHYHLALEFLLPVSDGEIFGIECYIVDRQGENAFSFLLNSHHRSFVDAHLRARDDTEAAREEMFERATEAAIDSLLQQLALARGDTTP